MSAVVSSRAISWSTGNQNFSYLNVETGEQQPLARDDAHLRSRVITREPYSERMVIEEPLDPFGDGHDHLIGDRELWNVVALRRELSGFMLQEQEQLLPKIDAFIELVSNEAGGASRDQL